MPDTTISFVDNALETLLKTRPHYLNVDLDFSVAYISAVGVSWLKPLLQYARRVRVVAGLCSSNRVNAFGELQQLGAEVFVYAAEPRTIFHPKIYYGTTSSQAWAMIGSSNLTQRGLTLNVERNLFITGQRLSEPFSAIETQLAAFRSRAYPFDSHIQKKLIAIENKMRTGFSEDAYFARLIDAGIKPTIQKESIIPLEVQDIALETLVTFARNTVLVHAYQMLLLLVILYRTDKDGQISQEEAATCILRFYQQRRAEGLSAERNRGSKVAFVNREANLTPSRILQMILIDPFPRFEKSGLLDVSEDKGSFVVNAALLERLTSADRDELRSIAIDRMTHHFEEDREKLEAFVRDTIG